MGNRKNKVVQQVGNPTDDGKALKGEDLLSDFFSTMDKHPCIAKNLKKIMDEQKLTLQSVSKKCKLPRSTIHNALVGREISMKTADKLRKGLGVSLAVLVYGVEETPSSKESTSNDLLSGVFEIVIRRHNQNKE